MKLSEAAKQYEECMENLGPCLIKDCPLKENITIRIGNLNNEGSEITWNVNCGCLMGKIDEFLKKKTLGEGSDIPCSNRARGRADNRS
jgi:hypothetical protein